MLFLQQFYLVPCCVVKTSVFLGELICMKFFNIDSNNSKEEELVPITDPVEFYVLMFNALLHLTPGIELTGFKENDDFSKERMSKTFA